MTHIVLLSAAAILIMAGYIFIFTGLSRQFQLPQDINDKLPISNKFEPLFWTFGTWKKFRQLEREQWPGSGRLRGITRLSIIGSALVLSGLLLGIHELGKH